MQIIYTHYPKDSLLQSVVACILQLLLGVMAQHTVNVIGDKHEFDPERWIRTGDQNEATTYQN